MYIRTQAYTVSMYTVHIHTHLTWLFIRNKRTWLQEFIYDIFPFPKKERRVGNCTHFYPAQVPQMLGSPHAGRQAKVRWLVPGMDVEWIP